MDSAPLMAHLVISVILTHSGKQQDVWLRWVMKVNGRSILLKSNAASLRSRTTVIGGLNPDYVCDGNPADQWHAAQVNMLTACRAYGLRAIDGPFGDFSDPDAFREAARRVAALGYEGKWAIHPSQIELANDVMSPPEAEVTRARRVLEALEEAAAAGKGAAQLDGKMIDIASEKMARNVIAQADQIVASSSSKR